MGDLAELSEAERADVVRVANAVVDGTKNDENGPYQSMLQAVDLDVMDISTMILWMAQEIIRLHEQVASLEDRFGSDDWRGEDA